MEKWEVMKFVMRTSDTDIFIIFDSRYSVLSEFRRIIESKVKVESFSPSGDGYVWKFEKRIDYREELVLRKEITDYLEKWQEWKFGAYFGYGETLYYRRRA